VNTSWWIPALRDRRLRERIWWWLAPSYARPEARHDLQYWRARQLSIDLSAIAIPLQEAMERIGRAFGDVAASITEALLPAMRSAGDAVLSFAAAWEGAKLNYQDEQPPHDGAPGGLW